MVEAFDVQVKYSRINVKLNELPEDLRQRLSGEALFLAFELRDVAQSLASGGLVQIHTGKFADSFKAAVRSSKTSVTGRVHSRAPQAAILEWGGTIPAHEILPNVAQALAFAFGGRMVFAAKVEHPATHIEKRGLLHAALASMEATIITDFKATVADATTGVTGG